MKKKDRQRMLEKYMKCAAWGSAGILLTCFIRGHVIKENGTVRELKISFLEKEKEDLETSMADPELYKDETNWAKTSKNYEDCKRHLERWYGKWEVAQEKIDAIDAELKLG